MGCPISRPSPTCLPKPRDKAFYQELVDAGFVYGKPRDQHNIMFEVTLPKGWSYYEIPNARHDDYVYDRLYDDTGKCVAVVDGKFTSHDFRCFLNKCENKEYQVDMTECHVSEDGYLVTPQTEFYDLLSEYRFSAGSWEGYPDRQKELNEMYEKVRSKGYELGLDCPSPIVLSDNPLKGVAKTFM